jgi:enolase
MSAIVDIVAREILDSRGNPTVECDVLLESGVMGRAAVPSGASTGSREAIELRDGDAARYLGKGVLQGRRERQHRDLRGHHGPGRRGAGLHRQDPDRPRRHREQVRLGANAMLAVSMAVAKAAAEESGLPLYRYFGGSGPMQMPVPMMNVINGGAHANNNLDLQEFMIMPVGAPSFREALRCGAEVFHALKKILTKGIDRRRRRRRLRAQPSAATRKRHPADPGGHRQGRLHAGSRRPAGPGLRGLRVLQGRQVHLAKGEGLQLSAEAWTDYLADLADKYPIISIEDGMAEGDWDGWKLLTDAWARRCRSSATTCSSPTPRS